MGLEVTDRIELTLHGSQAARKAAESFRDHLLAETLAVAWKWEKPDGTRQIECGNEICDVSLKKALDKSAQ
jgi:hypothetical protein